MHEDLPYLNVMIMLHTRQEISEFTLKLQIKRLRVI